MNDFDTLLAHVTSVANAAPALPGGEAYRDLSAYYNEKLSDNSNDSDDVKAMAERALDVASLDANLASVTGSTLGQPANALRRARAAALLAMSVLRDLNRAQLQAQLNRLTRMTTTAAVDKELLTTLRHGDTVRSTRHPKLELKNFASSGSAAFRIDIEDAYARVHDMLLHCEMQFLFAHGTLSGRIATAFNDYFGNPAAVIDTSTIAFQAGAKPTWTTVNQPRREVVREVLKRVCRNFVRQEVRIYYGGRGIDTGTLAYVSGSVNPTRIHVGGAFFRQTKRPGLDTNGGTLVHECTHTFSRTDDHAYDPAPCRQLAISNPAEALSNADSYMFFVESAFGR